MPVTNVNIAQEMEVVRISPLTFLRQKLHILDQACRLTG